MDRASKYFDSRGSRRYSLKTNNEINELIADRVFELEPVHAPGFEDCLGWRSRFTNNEPRKLKEYASNVEEALSIIHKLKNTWSLHWDKPSGKWIAWCDPKNNKQSSVVFDATDVSLARAICIAALKACGIKIE